MGTPGFLLLPLLCFKALSVCARVTNRDSQARKSAAISFARTTQESLLAGFVSYKGQQIASLLTSTG